MASAKQPGVKVAWRQVNVSEKFSSVLYPIDVFELLRTLPNVAYVVPDLVLRGTPEQGKPIATKGDIELLVNQENKTLGVRGRDIDATISAFRDLRKHSREQLDPSPALATQYVELDAQGWAETKTSATQAYARFWAGVSAVADLAKVLGEEAMNFGVQLCPPRDSNDPNWFHIYIEPLVGTAKRHRIRYVWRGQDTEAMLDKFRTVDDRIEKLISKIESY